MLVPKLSGEERDARNWSNVKEWGWLYHFIDEKDARVQDTSSCGNPNALAIALKHHEADTTQDDQTCHSKREMRFVEDA